MKYVLRRRDIIIGEVIEIGKDSIKISTQPNEYTKNGCSSYQVVWLEPVKEEE